jgi:uncharacterized protein (DUF2141 family)
MLAAALVMTGAAPPAHKVTVTVDGLRSSEGVVRACMTADQGRFPKCAGDPNSHRIVVPATAGSLKLVFKGVTQGQYAIALLHDENNNGKADRALGMMPKEGFGFSRDAPVRMAPPRYADARFAVGDGDVTLAIRMRYML